MDYKATLNLPKTSFPMKGNLPQTEPTVLARWEEQHLYQQQLERRKGAPAFVLHDGPPYANGDIHIGHALNKVLKDFVVRYQNMRGQRAPYVPGWDCHGLPIEYALMKELKVTKHQVNIVGFRRKARAYALKYVGIQRDQFKRLGVLGDWENSYLTLEPGFVAAELRVLKKLVEDGFVYQARKPVNWCWSCETALAEAEVEYQDREDMAIYVKFPVSEEHSTGVKWPAPLPNKTSVVIWTTTPWTLPANIALCFHPDAEYSLVEVEKNGQIEHFIIAKKLVDKVLGKTGHRRIAEHWSLLGKEFSIRKDDVGGLRCRNPFFERLPFFSLGLEDLGVSMEEGTGIIHIAPEHGEEDYHIAKRYEEKISPSLRKHEELRLFENTSLVNEKGQFTSKITNQFPEWGSQPVLQVNQKIIDELEKRGMLVHRENVPHSYPHCWRCHNPIIFRATDQWFLKVDHQDLRQKLLKVIKSDVQWIPPEGKDRIAGMVKTRPDWCISRQRLWGVPIPSVICKKCGRGELHPQVIGSFAEAIEGDPEGSDKWFSEPVTRWLPAGLKCACGAAEFERSTDILDVWFDSGVSHQGVLARRKDLSPPPADMYLEGSDQHRGWFQVSLITGVALSGKAPYRSVLTHGFVVDGEGRKMSKSLGNVIAPQQVIASLGADVLRLWVASSDYAEDIRISPTILAQVSELYRKIRNTLRFCLANVADFDAARSFVPSERMEEPDCWILSQLGGLVEQVTGAYEQFAYHRVIKAVHEFCTVRLSNFYLDVIKDPLYTSHPKDPRRLSIQTALTQLSETLIRIMAPILPVTMEEAWVALHPNDKESIHLKRWPDPGDYRREAALEDDWDRLLELRDQAMKALEKAREQGLIGDSLEAELEITVGDEGLWKFLEPRRAAFATACIVSSLRVLRANAPGSALEMNVRRSAGEKCQRCWMRLPTVGKSAEHPALCDRCVGVLERLAHSIG